MTDRGFFHPDVGYWQTIGEPSAQALNAYPEGTVEVPLRLGPHHEWTGVEWVNSGPPPPTLDDYRRAVDAHVEAVATARGYNNAATLASYVTSTVTAWAAEAAAFIPWRDSVWVATFDRLAAVEGGAEPPASPAALVAELPAPPWPLS